jgi:predicted Zn finger-like uncharacterized protein
MPILVSCPTCSRQLRVPDELLDKKVKCPTCGQVFEADSADNSPRSTTEPAAPSPKPETPPAAAKKSSSRRPPSGAKGDQVPCPYCRELISEDYSRCPYCGEYLDAGSEVEDDRPWERYGGRRDSEPHRGSLVLTLGIISVVVSALSVCLCPGAVVGLGLGITAWVMGHADLRKMQDGTMDRRGQGSTKGGWICGIIGTFLNGLGILAVGGWLAAMFLLN